MPYHQNTSIQSFTISHSLSHVNVHVLANKIVRKGNGEHRKMTHQCMLQTNLIIALLRQLDGFLQSCSTFIPGKKNTKKLQFKNCLSLNKLKAKQSRECNTESFKRITIKSKSRLIMCEILRIF